MDRPGQSQGVSSLTTTVAWRMTVVLSAQNELRLIGQSGIGSLFPTDKFDISYDGAMGTDDYMRLLKTDARASASTAPCYYDVVSVGNNHEDMMFGRRRLYSLITIREFKDGRFRKTYRRMIDPLNKIDDLYFVDDLAGMDKEIEDSFKNNATEFFVESRKWLVKR